MAAMRIQLLGKPTVDGGPGPRGRKAWGLLAFLLASDTPPSREQLASLLFEDADDPLRALRWNLSELRKALPAARVPKGDPVHLELPPDAVVDVEVLKRSSWVEAIELPGLGRDLLEGVNFDSSPTMEAWLLNERRHIRSATEAVLREAVMGLLGLDRAERAVALSTMLSSLDPLNEDYQALLLRSLKMTGDDASAEKQARSFTTRLRRELGVEPGPAIAQALHGEEASSRAPGADASAIAARLESAELIVRSGRLEEGLRDLAEVATAAGAVGRVDLQAGALLAAGSALVHTDRSRHEEGSSLLHQVIPIAERLKDAPMKATAHRELAWVEFMAGRYDRARRWIFKAPAEALEDPVTRSGALWILGKAAAETGHYEESLELLRSSVAQARNGDDPMRLAFSLTSLGRSYLLLRRLDDAAESLEEGIRVVRFAGLARLAALPEAFLGEVRLLQGSIAEAQDVIEHSFATAREVGDPSMEALARRARGLLSEHEGNTESALDVLKSARLLMIKSPDHIWSQAYAVDALCDIGSRHRSDEVSNWVEELAALAARCGMKEMLARTYLYRARLGESDALEKAKLIAREVDNPHLHAVLEEGVATPARA